MNAIRVVIITKSEERNVKRRLDLLKPFADEIK